MFVFASSSMALTAAVAAAIIVMALIVLIARRRRTSPPPTTPDVPEPAGAAVRSAASDAAVGGPEPGTAEAPVEEAVADEAVAEPREEAVATGGSDSASVVEGDDLGAAIDGEPGPQASGSDDAAETEAALPEPDTGSGDTVGAAPRRTHPDIVRFVDGLRLRPAPVTDLVADTVVGRMTRAEDRIDRFTTLAGVDGDVDRTLLQRACTVDDAVGWISLRVSPDMVAPDLIALVEATLVETDRRPDTLMLDLPADRSPSKAVIDTLTGLADLGVHLGLHGVGTDPDLLMEYEALPLSYVSIDHGQLAPLGEDGDRIARLLHQLSHDLGFDPIAIGVPFERDGERIHRFILEAVTRSVDRGEVVSDGATRRRRSALHPDFAD